MGPRTEPCGTPDVTGTVADFSLSIRGSFFMFVESGCTSTNIEFTVP